MEIILYLKNYFIGTAIKKLHEQQLEYLKFLFENTDFMHLRNIYPELEGSEEKQILLKLFENKHDAMNISDKKKLKLFKVPIIIITKNILSLVMPLLNYLCEYCGKITEILVTDFTEQSECN